MARKILEHRKWTKIILIFLLYVMATHEQVISLVNYLEVNSPNALLIQENINQNSLIKLEWLDSINDSNFNFHIYKKDAPLSDLEDISKAEQTVDQTLLGNTIQKKLKAGSSLDSFVVKVSLTQQTKARYCISVNNGKYCGLYTPPAQQVTLIPFDISNTAACDLQFYFTSLSGPYPFVVLSRQVKLYKPGSDPLTSQETLKFDIPFKNQWVYNSQAGTIVKIPSNQAGRWTAKISTSYATDNVLYYPNIIIQPSSSQCSGCENKCAQLTRGLNVLENPCPKICQSNQLYDPASDNCYLNCSKYANVGANSKLFPSQNKRCQCSDANKAWNKLFLSCTKQCPNSYTRDDLPLVSDGNCLCSSGYYWDRTQNFCLVDCSLIPFAQNVRVDSKTCACQNKFKWLPYQEQILGRLLQDFGPVNEVGQCAVDCSSIPHTATNCYADPEAEIKSCKCQFGYQWNQGNLQCESICPLGFDYKLNYQKGTSRCERICDRAANPFVVGNNPTDPTQCSCDTDFVWNAATSKCERNCTKVAYSTGLNTQLPNQCLCSTGLVWSECSARCQRNCSYSADANAIEVSKTNVLQCACKELYAWDTATSKCKATSDTSVCTCPKDLIWSSRQLACVRNCSKDPYASCVNSYNKTECDCVVTLFRTYVWSRTYQKCVPYCIFGMTWNDPLQRCVFQLWAAGPNSDTNSDSTETEMVQQKQIEMAAQQQERRQEKEKSVIIGLGTLSGILILLVAGMIVFICKKRKATKNEEKEDDRSSKKAESAKDIMIEA